MRNKFKVPVHRKGAHRTPVELPGAVSLRAATIDDVNELDRFEQGCFELDRISRRQFRWMITRGNAALQVAVIEQVIVGYVLVLFHRGTSLARVYSLAVAASVRGAGLGARLLEEAERIAVDRDCIYLRLEVQPANAAAIELYERLGYGSFGSLTDYYQDHSDALRYQKRIRNISAEIPHLVPYFEQSLNFSCGPACLIMAMQALDPTFTASRSLEIQLWREATTVYMTSGHGGCSPQGLALAAHRRGFAPLLLLSNDDVMFLDGVRKAEKKDVLRIVHEDFMAEIAATDITVRYAEFTSATLIEHLTEGLVPLVLISSYRFNSAKAPHWVVLAAADDKFVYLHDPDVDSAHDKIRGDTQYVPVRHEEFDHMIRFGQFRTQAALCLSLR